MTACTASASRIWCVMQLHDRKGEGGKFGPSALSVGLGGVCRSAEPSEQ